MRLGQLARRLAIKTDEIVRHLASRQITIESGNNTRLDEAHVELILQEFAPANEVLQNEINVEPDRPEPMVTNTEPDAPLLEQSVSEPSEILETIKAPKVELAGLKVLGKIDLPEKKKPEQPEATEATQAPSPPPRRPYKSNSQPRAWKNPISIEREREERLKREKLNAQREEEKDRRKEFYLKRIKPQGPTKRARMVDEEMIEMSPLEPEAPKTWFGRFIRWLNT